MTKLKIVLAVLFVIAVVCGLLSTSQSSRSRGKDEKVATCAVHLRLIGGALRAYAIDNDDHLPPEGAWMDSLKDYMRNDEVFRCPNAVPMGGYGYALRQGIGGKRLGSLPKGELSLLAFESRDVSRNATASLSSLPSPGRHDGENYGLTTAGKVVRLR